MIHHPCRQLGGTDHFKDFRKSETDMAEINGENQKGFLGLFGNKKLKVPTNLPRNVSIKR